MTATHFTPILSQRARSLLKLLVGHYIKTGSPVGSKTLSTFAGVDLSPASIRHVMAELEKEELICSLHTSSGRIPTAKGYRYFVEQLLTVRPIKKNEIEIYKDQLGGSTTPDEVAKAASSLLSSLTHLVGVVTTPTHTKMLLRKIEFLPLSDNRVLLILVLNQEQVQNRVLQMERAYTASELEQAGRFLNAHYAGLELKDIYSDLKKTVEAERERLGALMDKIMQQVASQQDCIVEGQNNLLTCGEAPDIQKIRELFRELEHKRVIIDLLDQCRLNRGLQVLIGQEVGHQALDDYAFVTTPYFVNGEMVGALGVVGPTRMAYDKVIPMVNLTAQLLGAVLER